jgi:hypothetical protein
MSKICKLYSQNHTFPYEHCYSISPSLDDLIILLKWPSLENYLVAVLLRSLRK